MLVQNFLAGGNLFYYMLFPKTFIEEYAVWWDNVEEDRTVPFQAGLAAATGGPRSPQWIQQMQLLTPKARRLDRGNCEAGCFALVGLSWTRCPPPGSRR